MNHKELLSGVLLPIALGIANGAPLEHEFQCPPDAARPGVYWYFMDGNFNGPEMLKDLDSMKEHGLGNALFLEVDAGVPRGPVKFMSEEWQNLVTGAMRHAERLGIDITLGAGPGWCGSGGPWVKPEQSMQHLVFSTVDTKGPAKVTLNGRTYDTQWMPPFEPDVTDNLKSGNNRLDVLVTSTAKGKPALGTVRLKTISRTVVK